MAFNYTNLEKYVAKVMKQELKKDANITQEIMRGEVPVDTGALQASIGIVESNSGNEIGYKIGHRPALLIAKSGEDYGNLVYYGSGKRKPNRWIERTVVQLPSNFTKTRSTI